MKSGSLKCHLSVGGSHEAIGTGLAFRTAAIAWLLVTVNLPCMAGTETVTSVYVSTSGSTGVGLDQHGLLPIINASTDAITTTLDLGNFIFPFRVAFAHDGRTAYVSGRSRLTTGGDALYVVDTLTGQTVTTTIHVPNAGQSVGLAVTPDDTYVYVAVPDSSDNSQSRVAVVRTADNAVVANIPVAGFPGDVAVTPDGAFVYVTNSGRRAQDPGGFLDSSVYVIRTSDNAVVANVLVGAGAGSVAITPDGIFAYVTSHDAHTVSVIDTHANVVVATLSTVPGYQPADIAITPDGAFAYVVTRLLSTVSVIRTMDNSIVATIPVGADPLSVAITPDGALAYVANSSPGATTGSVSVIDTASNTVVATLPIVGHPTSVDIVSYVLPTQSGDPVTLAVTGRVHNFTTSCYGLDDDFPCAGVDPATTPFGVGDELRLVLTYDPSVRGVVNGIGRRSDGTRCYYWDFTPAIKFARMTVDGYTFAGNTGSNAQINACDFPYANVDGRFHVAFGGSLYGPTVVPDLTGQGWSLRLDLASSCMDPDFPSLPPTGLDPAICPVLAGSGVNGWFKGTPNRVYEDLVLYATDDLRIERVTATASVGAGVVVSPAPSTGIVLTFDGVTASGDVHVTSFGPTDPAVPPAPSAFDFGGNIFEIETTAHFAGNVEICLPWSNPAVEPTMLHYTNGAWDILPVSTSVPGVYCAKTTSFSPFALVVPGAASRNLKTLIDAITKLNLKKGLSNSLDAKLAAAKQALSDMRNNNDVAAQGSMGALVNEVNAQRGKGLTAAEADSLLLLAQSVISHL